MKKHLEIIKGFGLFLLLFVLVSATAASDDSTYKASVTIVQVSSSEEGDDGNTVTNTYTKESDSPDIHVTGVISGNDASVITNVEDTSPTESIDSGATRPDFRLGELTPEDYNDELSEWVWSIIDEDPLLTIDDFPKDVTDIINVK